MSTDPPRRPRRGSPERPIPPDAVAKELGEYLRALRQAVGGPAYRTLARDGFYSQNWLSQTANGRQLYDETRIQGYVTAILRYADRVGIDVNREMRQCAEAFGVPPDADVKDQALAIRRRIELRLAGTAESGPAAEPAAGPKPLPASLAEARTVPDLVAALNDMIAGHGWDVSAPRNPHSVPEYLHSPEAQDALTGRRPLTAATYLNILSACGADQPEWAAAWTRVAPADRLPTEPAGLFRRWAWAIRRRAGR